MNRDTVTFVDVPDCSDLLHAGPLVPDRDRGAERLLPPGTFFGGEIEPGTFHGGEIEPGTFHAPPDVWVDDRPDVNEPLLTSAGTDAAE